MTDATKDVLAERARQIEQEGMTLAHDDNHKKNELLDLAVCYVMNDFWYTKLFFPSAWDIKCFKPTTERRNLVKACALILAEIERLDRAGNVCDKCKGEKYFPLATKGEFGMCSKCDGSGTANGEFPQTSYKTAHKRVMPCSDCNGIMSLDNEYKVWKCEKCGICLEDEAEPTEEELKADKWMVANKDATIDFHKNEHIMNSDCKQQKCRQYELGEKERNSKCDAVCTKCSNLLPDNWTPNICPECFKSVEKHPCPCGGNQWNNKGIWKCDKCGGSMDKKVG